MHPGPKHRGGAATLTGLLLASTWAFTASAAQQDSRIRHGVVTDSAGTPVRDAEVRVVVADSVASISRSSDSGRFTIEIPRVTGSRLVVRRFGYVRVDRSLDDLGPSDTIRVRLAQAAVALESMEVFAEEEPGLLADFFRRRRENSFGRFFTHEEIQASGKHSASELLRQTPGVTLAASRRFGYVVRMRGCRDAPMVWLDGGRVPGAELDEIIRPDDIAGMEVYASTAGVPAQFLDRSNRGCGTILIWTRHK